MPFSLLSSLCIKMKPLKFSSNQTFHLLLLCHTGNMDPQNVTLHELGLFL